MLSETPARQNLMQRFAARRSLTAAVFICAVIVQCGFLGLLPNSLRANESADYRADYAPVAQNILSGKGAVDASGMLETGFPPGYPAFLAGAFFLADSVGAERAAFVVRLNILLMSLSCVLVFWTADRIFGKRIALLSSGLWITCFFNLWLTKQPNSEVPFIPLLYGAVYCVIGIIQKPDAKRASLSGLLLAMAALTRPIALLLPFFLAVAILLDRTVHDKKRVICAVMVIGCFVLALVPWEYEVYAHTGQIAPLSTNGPSSMFDGLVFVRRGNSPERLPVPQPAAELMRRILAHQRELKTTGSIVRYMSSELRQDPVAVVELLALKAVRCWYGTENKTRETPIAFVQALYLALGVGGTYLTWKRLPSQRHYVLLFLGLIVYFWAMTAVAMPIVRYLVPAMAYLLILAGVAVDALVFREARP